VTVHQWVNAPGALIGSDKVALRVAVVGCGAQGRVHLSHLAGMADVEISSVCDRDSARLAATVDEFGARRGFLTYQELMESGTHDLVIVCVMPVDHRAVAVAALERGAHVLCEKPFAMNAKEAADMVAAAHAAARILTVGTNMRFLGNARYLKGLIDAGRLGRHAHTRAWTYSAGIPWWGRHYTRSISAGGALASTAVHILDCALFLADFPRPVAVSGTTARLYPTKRGGTAPATVVAEPYDVEDLVSALVRFDDGTSLALEGSWTYDRPESSYGLEFVGTHGTGRLDPLEVYVDESGLPTNVTPDPVPGASWSDSIGVELADVVGAIREGRQPDVTAEQALTVQRIVDAIYRSAATGREVRFD
jgi:predicted dehydrogenase